MFPDSNISVRGVRSNGDCQKLCRDNKEKKGRKVGDLCKHPTTGKWTQDLGSAGVVEEALLGSVWFRVRELTATQRITQISDTCSQLFVSVSANCSQLFVSVSAKKKKTFSCEA